MVINGSAAVRLKVYHLGGFRGFGIEASVDLSKGEIIYELAGLTATDSKTPHSELSAIMTHPSQGMVEKSRILFGPIRFVNHLCSNFNAEVSALINMIMPLFANTPSLVCCHRELVCMDGANKEGY